MQNARRKTQNETLDAAYAPNVDATQKRLAGCCVYTTTQTQRRRTVGCRSSPQPDRHERPAGCHTPQTKSTQTIQWSRGKRNPITITHEVMGVGARGKVEKTNVEWEGGATKEGR